MIDEKKYVVETFLRYFSDYKKKKLVIYGLGKNTKVLLDELPEYNFVGLMDGVRTGDEVWGLPVITCDEAKVLGVDAIIILARSANVSIIYRRIREQCIKLNIPVFDINGQEQKDKEDEFILNDAYKGNTKERLLEKIDEAEVISFDVFDTLLVRKVLYPTDVFKNVYRKQKGILLSEEYPYVKNRILAEREMYLYTNPTIEEIYQKMVEEYALDEDIAEKLKNAEVSEEYECLCARDEMKTVMQYAINQQKIICCTSDMYLPESIIIDLLKANGFLGIDKIFVSCEYRKAKCNGLFQILRDTYSGKRVLHVGDNQEADIDAALRHGIEDVFKIASSYQMLEDSKAACVLQLVQSLEDRNTLGRFISGIFNNPFLFNDTQGKLSIRNCFDLGYYYLEPLIASFMEWMVEKCKQDKIELLLLAARDGWLFMKLFNFLNDKGVLNFSYMYFYTSRLACTLAGLEDEADIFYAASLAFDGTIEEQLKQRFLLDDKDIQTRERGETDKEYLHKHVKVILNNVKMHRERYKKYASDQTLANKKIGFFDFVSSGTCQLWLEKIYSCQTKGYYFVRIYDEYKRNLDIKSLFEQKCVYERQSRIFDNFFFMENVFSSPEPSLRCFDVNGGFVFEKEERNAEQMKNLDEVQCGIICAFEERINRGIGLPNKELADMLLDFVRGEYSNMEFSYFANNILKDEFCNREFQLEEMMGGK